ncbi:MAG: TldD/PmbA family protein [Firmicutes bacterium]|nr:TldD/PmbA family protein [Bacillota bacterium]
MSELKTLEALLRKELQERGVTKYAYVLSESEKQELNTEGADFKLMRTVFGGGVSLTVFDGARKGSASGNDRSEEGLKAIVESAVAAAASSPEDTANDIAPDQGRHEFRQGACEPDFDRFFARLKELQGAIAADHPKVRVMQLVGDHTRSHSVYANSNGTRAESFNGSYDVTFEFSATDGEKNTGLDYAFLLTDTLDTPFIELSDFRRKLSDIEKQIDPQPLSGKFEGTAVITPGCLADLLSMTLQNYAGSGVILDGTSLWLDKVGEQVADERITVAFDPFDPTIVCGERVTGDGFLSEPAAVIENGVLKAHMLSLYAANKTGRPVMKNSGSGLVMKAGEQSLEEIVSGIEKGLLVGGFSGGQPGTNGEFSGVAKNSFLIENGRVTRAVTETMINGNLGDMLRHVRGISRERDVQGVFTLPYLAVDGIVISGK